MRIVLLGPPGSGKGTQAAVLARELGVPTISSGEIFRANVAAGTELGRPLDVVVSLEVGEDELRRRLATRAEEQDRAEDEDEDAIRRRLELFDRETEPLLDFYDGQGLLVSVEAEGDANEVTGRVAAALDGRGDQGAA